MNIDVNKINIVRFSECDNEFNMYECGICFDEYQTEQNIFVLKCKHIICEPCGNKVFETSNKCPFCRKDLIDPIEKVTLQFNTNHGQRSTDYYRDVNVPHSAEEIFVDDNFINYNFIDYNFVELPSYPDISPIDLSLGEQSSPDRFHTPLPPPPYISDTYDEQSSPDRFHMYSHALYPEAMQPSSFDYYRTPSSYMNDNNHIENRITSGRIFDSDIIPKGDSGTRPTLSYSSRPGQRRTTLRRSVENSLESYMESNYAQVNRRK